MFAIQLISDPGRHLTAVSMSGISFNLGKGSLQFSSREEAETLQTRFAKWEWSGTEIVPV